MTNLSFAELDGFFRNDNFPGIEDDARGTRFLRLRSISRSETIQDFCAVNNLDISTIKKENVLQHIFDSVVIQNEHFDNFIRQKYLEQRSERKKNEDFVVDQLSRLTHFDWGGSFGNSLEKNIVNNYVKVIQSYDKINEEIDSSLLASLRGYTLNSWYNHWTSILIEDIFKDHPRVLPTIGLIKKIDFFIDGVPFDLKVTYFPEELMEGKLKNNGYGVELTRLKQCCRRLNIYIPSDLSGKSLKQHLINKIAEDPRSEASDFLSELKQAKQKIINDAESNPDELKKWFYENQGEARFDAANRFFLVLVSENDLTESWKLKRNHVYLSQKIREHLDTLSHDKSKLDTEFFWKPHQKAYRCKSDILFIKS